MYVYIYICIYIYVCIYTYICIYVCIMYNGENTSKSDIIPN